MPSASLLQWRNDRMPRLAEVDAQCAATLALVPASPNLVDENFRGYVLLLSAHFQGYCRDLYGECAQTVVSKVRPSLQVLLQAQFNAHRKLDHGNPNLQSLREDFERFGFTLDLAAADPANPVRLRQLGELNRWRNVAAHHGTIPASLLPLDLALLRSLRNACDGLARSLDDIMDNQVRRILRRAPWVP
jgi:hypothetical protein